MINMKTLLLLSGLALGTLAQAASSVQTSRFTVGATTGEVRQGETANIFLADKNQGPDTATNTVLTYTPPTTPGITVNSVTTSLGGVCLLTAGQYVCPPVPTVGVNQTVEVKVNVTAAPNAATGPVAGSLKADSDQYNPGSGAGDLKYSVWGAPGVSGAAGDAFWFAFDGTYDDQGEKNEPPTSSQGQLSDLTGSWPVNAANPVGAYSQKFDDPSYGSSDNPNDAVLPASPTHPLPYNAYGTQPGTVQAASNQFVLKTPPSVLLPFAPQQSSQNNRRVWEVRSGFYLAQPTTVYACVSDNDDGMYVAIDPDQGGGVVAFNGTYAIGAVDSTPSTLAAGYHEVVYRIFNRNNQRQPSGSNSANGFSFETGTAQFDEIGLGTAPSTGGAGACSTANHDTFTRVVPTATFTVTPGTDLALTKAGPDYYKPGQQLDYVLSVRNLGSAASTYTVTDTLPSGTGLIAAGQGGTYDLNTNTVTWTGAIAAGATVTLNLSLQGPDQATIDGQATLAQLTNTAEVASSLSDVNGSNDTSSSLALLIDPVLTKQAANLTAGTAAGTDVRALPGASVEYCVTARNPGISLNGFVVSDAVPANMTADLNGYGPGVGIQVTRGGVTTTRTSTAADADGGRLDTSLRVDLGTLANQTSAVVCFKATVN